MIPINAPFLPCQGDGTSGDVLQKEDEDTDEEEKLVAVALLLLEFALVGLPDRCCCDILLLPFILSKGILLN